MNRTENRDATIAQMEKEIAALREEVAAWRKAAGNPLLSIDREALSEARRIRARNINHGIDPCAAGRASKESAS